jgi:hypothetical protein
VTVRQGATQFASSTFDVTTFGQTFMRGADGRYVLENFPTAGQDATIEWSEGSQNFLVVGRDSGVVVPTPTPAPTCPSSGPIQNLTRDCSDFLYYYSLGSAIAGISSTGAVVALCMTAPGVDVLCFGGPVQSATTFGLTAGNVDGGPFVPLDAGSGGNLTLGGQRLNVTIRLQGDTTVFSGFSYFDTEPLSAADAAASSEGEDDALRTLADALAATMEAGSADAEQAQGVASSGDIRTALDAMRSAAN